MSAPALRVPIDGEVARAYGLTRLRIPIPSVAETFAASSSSTVLKPWSGNGRSIRSQPYSSAHPCRFPDLPTLDELEIRIQLVLKRLQVHLLLFQAHESMIDRIMYPDDFSIPAASTTKVFQPHRVDSPDLRTPPNNAEADGRASSQPSAASPSPVVMYHGLARRLPDTLSVC